MKKARGRNIFGALISRDTIKLASALASTVALTKGTNCALRKLRNVEDGWNSFCAGIIGSLGLLLDEEGRRVSLGLLLTTRTLQYLCRYLIRIGRLPEIPHADVLVMCLANWGVIYGFLMNPRCLPVSLQSILFVAFVFVLYYASRRLHTIRKALARNDGYDSPSD